MRITARTRPLTPADGGPRPGTLAKAGARKGRPKPAARAFARVLTVVVLAMSGLLATPGAGATTPGSTRDASTTSASPKPGTSYAKGVPVCRKPAPGHRGCFAMRRVVVSSKTPGAHAFTVSATPGPAGGLTPAELASAYGYSTAGGAGQTVGIVDAFNDPNIETDLGTFDTQYGLTACTRANGCLTVVGQTGSKTALPADDTTGWSAEESLDVEAVRAVCPNCKILLVETNDSFNANLDAGVNTAVAMGAKVVSNSYGGPEAGVTATDIAAYNHPGVVITASTGDNGWFDWDRVNVGGISANMPSTPASLNTVVSVGGTSLNLTQAGGRASEAVWNNDGPQDFYGSNLGLTGATGGGCSTLINAKSWQSHVPGYAATTCGTRRLAADVAAVADPLTGFDIVDSFACGGCPAAGWSTFGGTSLSAPLVAAMWALAGGAGGAANPSLSLYGHLKDLTPSLYDVTVGGNGYCDGETVGDCGTTNPNSLGFGMIDCEYTSTASPGTPSTGTAQCDAAPGYDGPTGVGTPKGLTVFKPVQYAVLTLPTTLPLNTPEVFTASKSVDPYPGGTITSYLWKWGDGTPNSSGISPTHTYTAAGTYSVSLSEVDSYGAKAARIVKVTLGAKPTAVITAPTTITHAIAATFSGASSTDTNTGGRITSYHWSWGDGTTTTTSSASVAHTYVAAGSKTVTLTVKDNYGNTSVAAARTVTVG